MAKAKPIQKSARAIVRALPDGPVRAAPRPLSRIAHSGTSPAKGKERLVIFRIAHGQGMQHRPLGLFHDDAGGLPLVATLGQKFQKMPVTATAIHAQFRSQKTQLLLLRQVITVHDAQNLQRLARQGRPRRPYFPVMVENLVQGCRPRFRIE